VAIGGLAAGHRRDNRQKRSEAEGAERNKALGIWGALGGVGATTAWLIGGPLVDGPGWRWIFFIKVPVGLAALALSPGLLRESLGSSTRRSYDPAGRSPSPARWRSPIGGHDGEAALSLREVAQRRDALGPGLGAEVVDE
jgi:MFS family permease